MRSYMQMYLSVVFIIFALLSNILHATKQVPQTKRRVVIVPKVRDLGDYCEYLAYLELLLIYPKRHHQIYRNVFYKSNKVKGELDLVVVHKETSSVVSIGEVKCRKNLYRAAKLADKQLRRFMQLVRLSSQKDPQGKNWSKHITLRAMKPRTTLKMKQFYKKIIYRKICQKNKNAKKFGFQPLRNSLQEILQMQ